jgi:hypothetical protein
MFNNDREKEERQGSAAGIVSSPGAAATIWEG